MKKLFRFFSIALAASTMMFTACTEENNGQNPDQPATPTYTITVQANNADWGTVSGGGVYAENATATLTATAAEGYTFVGWADGNNQNPRLVTVTGDATYTANFEAKAGVEVSFGTTNWTPSYINGQLASNAIMLRTAQTNATSYPQAQITLSWGENGTATTGTMTGAHRLIYNEAEGTVGISFGDAYVWYFESTYVMFESGLQAGDWWSKDCTANVTALDADALTVSMTVNATMAHITDIITDEGLISIDINDCEARNLSATVINQTLSRYNGKGIMKNASLRIK
ncbi:MAG: hypothetical protein MJZ99_02930 [Bacteroidales bacterium]|nr:hypothetical protein [Candidatus Colimorpha merdihippi]MCQ2281562.1 hypothetical protein [Bacteroidales bacterium]